jgi:nicotinate-nucleotide pyrophosphorylase (carboxylating)
MPIERQQRLEQALFRGGQLTMENREYARFVRSFVDPLLEADLAPRDATVAALGIGNSKGEANVIARETGVAAGLEEYAFILRNHGLHVTLKKEDGDVFQTGDTLVRAEGRHKKLLSFERVGLNVLQRMCGIATATQRLQERARRRCSATRIVGTRKTPWGLMDKRAIHLGGGGTHRLGLGDGIVIKNNHLALLARREEQAVPIALAKAWKARRGVAFIEVEVRGEEAALVAGHTFKRLQSELGPIARKKAPPCLIMLDNMLPEDARTIIVTMRKQRVWDFALIEVSGGISETNLELYAEVEVDAISIGKLTHSVRALDLSQRIS